MEEVKLDLEESVDNLEKGDRYFSCAKSDFEDYHLFKQEEDSKLDFNKNAVFLQENHSSQFEDSRSNIESPIDEEDIDHGQMKTDKDITLKNDDCVISSSKLHIINGQLKGEKLKCEFCDYDTENTIELKAHMKRVHRQFEFKCHICNYSNPLEFCLKRHVALEHPEKREFKCSLCDYSTHRRNNLRDHVNAIHLKLKNFKCEICNYGSYRKTYLQTHVDSVHLQLKKYKCQSCDYSTNRKLHLNYHVNSVHLMNKRFKCNFCEYSSTRKYSLKVHVDRMH